MERITISELFDRNGLAAGDRDALIFPAQHTRWSYREAHTRVTQLAKGLMGLGVDSGDRVAVYASDRAEWVLLQLAVARIGAILVPIDPHADADTLASLLAHAEVSTLFLTGSAGDTRPLDVASACCPEIRTARPGRLASRRLPHLKRVALLDDHEDDASGVLAWADVLAAGAGITDHLLRRRQEAIQATDLVAIHYVGAAPDPARGVELTHLNLVNNALTVGTILKLDRRDRVCVPVPFAEPFGCVLGTLAVLGRGATLVGPAEHFDAGATLQAIAEEHCTVLYGTPRMLQSMLRHPRVIHTDFSGLRTGIVMGGTWSPELMTEIGERLRLRSVTVAWGLPEATAVITQTRPEDSLDARITTVGRALPGVEVKIVHPKSGVEVALGVEGELCCRGSLVMRGYHESPELTAATIGRNGWLRTGRLAVMDQYGYCTITGRVDAQSGQTMRDPDLPGPNRSPVI
jgi:fatty-acyl-CoA synthase